MRQVSARLSTGVRYGIFYLLQRVVGSAACCGTRMTFGAYTVTVKQYPGSTYFHSRWSFGQPQCMVYRIISEAKFVVDTSGTTRCCITSTPGTYLVCIIALPGKAEIYVFVFILERR